MYNNKKLVAYIMGNRTDYIKLLVPQLLCNNILDEIILCVTASDHIDINYAETLEKQITDSRFRLLYTKYRHVSSPLQFATKAFWEVFSYSTDEDTIYFKIDDDVLFISPNYFEEQAKFKIDHPEYVFQYPFIINNPLCYAIKQNKTDRRQFLHDMWLLVHTPKLAGNQHISFLNTFDFTTHFIQNFEFDETYNGCGLNDQYIDCRASINALCFTGKDMRIILDLYHKYVYQKLVNYVVNNTLDEEQFFTKEVLIELQRKNIIVGNNLVCHYAYCTQRPALAPFERQLLMAYKNYIINTYKNIKFI